MCVLITIIFSQCVFYSVSIIILYRSHHQSVVERCPVLVLCAKAHFQAVESTVIPNTRDVNKDDGNSCMPISHDDNEHEDDLLPDEDDFPYNSEH